MSGFVRRIVAPAVSLAGLALVPAAHANSYQIVDLGVNMMPNAIDSKGNIAGELAIEHERALIYSNGKWRQEPSQHQFASAVAVDKDSVAGNIGESPALWVHHGQPLYLPLPGGASVGVATGVDSAGEVSGYFTADFGNHHCFVWSSATGLSQDLGQLAPAGDICEDSGMDSRGWVYGHANAKPAHRWIAFVWRDGQMHKLPSLPPTGGDAFALAGNAARDVVGWANGNRGESNFYRHAALWHEGAVEDLLPDSDWTPSEANAINDAGTIVGEAYDQFGDQQTHAMRFEAGAFVELEDEVVNLGDWALRTARGVAPDGVIVGWGVRGDGLQHGYMLMPQ